MRRALFENLTLDGNLFRITTLPIAGVLIIGNVSWDPTSQLASIANEPISATNLGLTFIKAFDLDGEGSVDNPTLTSVADNTVQEIERTYVADMTWIMERTGGWTFSNGTTFYFSFIGVQYADSQAFVPEPPTVLLFAGSVLGASLFRRRRN